LQTALNISPTERRPTPIAVPQAASIFVSHFANKVAWIRVAGKGNLHNSPRLLSFAKCMISKGEARLVVDLEDCPVMDSTFMGTLTGISRRLKKLDGGMLEVINANERNVELIESLGLDFILTLDTDGSCWKSERQAISKQFRDAAIEHELEPEELSKEEKTEFILEAHENLTEANPENIPRFEDVICYLKQEAEGS
jgi:anti-anti-sigma factor